MKMKPEHSPSCMECIFSKKQKDGENDILICHWLALVDVTPPRDDVCKYFDTAERDKNA